MQQEESATATPITIFYSYAPEDKSYLEGLQRHLKTLHYPGDIFHVDNRQVPAGADRKQAIKDYLDKASIILFLVSSHFTGSDCLLEDEVEPALSRFEAGTAHVIPILLRPVNIEGTPFKDFQCLPRDDKPVSKWPDKEQAFLSIQKDMQVVINKLNNSRQNLVDKDQGHNSREVKNSERVATNSQERSQTEHVQRLLGL